MCHANASGYSVCNFINVNMKCLSMLVKRAKDKTYGESVAFLNTVFCSATSEGILQLSKTFSRASFGATITMIQNAMTIIGQTRSFHFIWIQKSRENSTYELFLLGVFELILNKISLLKMKFSRYAFSLAVVKSGIHEDHKSDRTRIIKVAELIRTVRGSMREGAMSRSKTEYSVRICLC